MNILKIALHWQILIAILLATLAGSLTASEESIAFYVYGFMGDLFLDALKMIVIPLIISSIICAVMDIGSGDFGRLGTKTVLFYLLTSTVSIITGLLLMNTIQPGVNNALSNNPDKLEALTNVNASQVSAALDKVSGHGYADVVQIVSRMVPDNIVVAASENNILALIFFSLLFGFFISRLEKDGRQVMHKFWRASLDVVLGITHWVLLFTPLGVFGLIAKVVTVTGFSAFAPVLAFFFAVLLALLMHLLINQSIILYYGAKSKPLNHIRAMFPALLTAFSTASSSATIPVTLSCVRERVGVSERTAGFILPLGSTVNMDGTALYECMAVMFIAQIYGVDLSLTAQVLIVVTALLTSIGVAGIPAASLVAIGIILGTLGLPLEGIGLLLITDRVLDMVRTAVNVYGDSVGAAVVARSEGEKFNYSGITTTAKKKISKK